MTHVFDTSAVLAHYLAETGAERVQALFDDPSAVIGICVISLLEFETRLHAMGLGETERRAAIQQYKQVIDEIVPIDEALCARAAELKRVPALRCARAGFQPPFALFAPLCSYSSTATIPGREKAQKTQKWQPIYFRQSVEFSAMKKA